jgi:hypothetical protein
VFLKIVGQEARAHPRFIIDTWQKSNNKNKKQIFEQKNGSWPDMQHSLQYTRFVILGVCGFRT